MKVCVCACDDNVFLDIDQNNILDTNSMDSNGGHKSDSSRYNTRIYLSDGRDTIFERMSLMVG